MRTTRPTLVVACALGLLFLLRLVVYTVRDDEVAVVLTFGRPTGEQEEPGPGLKLPWPVQQVKTVDRRLRVLEAPLEEMISADGRAILVGSFALWRVTSARRFLERLGDAEAAERLLEKSLRTAQAAAVSRTPMSGLVSTDPEQLRYAEVEQAMLEVLRTETRDTGLEVTLVGIRRLGLPEQAAEAVFERMRKEREARAAAIEAEGDAEAGRIRARAERQRDELINAAEVAARAELGEVAREAAEHYAVLAEDPELARLLEWLEALEALLDRRTTLIFDTSQPPFDLLRRRGEAAPVDTRGAGPR